MCFIIILLNKKVVRKVKKDYNIFLLQQNKSYVRPLGWRYGESFFYPCSQEKEELNEHNEETL